MPEVKRINFVIDLCQKCVERLKNVTRGVECLKVRCTWIKNKIPYLSYCPIKMRQVLDVHCYLTQLCVNTPLLMNNTGQITSCRVYIKGAPTLH